MATPDQPAGGVYVTSPPEPRAAEPVPAAGWVTAVSVRAPWSLASTRVVPVSTTGVPTAVVAASSALVGVTTTVTVAATSVRPSVAV